MSIKIIECKTLYLGNRDGEILAAKDEKGICYLIAEAYTFHNEEVFEGYGSTQHIIISEEAYAALPNDKHENR